MVLGSPISLTLLSIGQCQFGGGKGGGGRGGLNPCQDSLGNYPSSNGHFFYFGGQNARQDGLGHFLEGFNNPNGRKKCLRVPI